MQVVLVEHRQTEHFPALFIGSPEQLADSYSFRIEDDLLAAKPDDFDVTIITTYPGTPYYDRAVPHPTQKDVWVYTYEATGDKTRAAEHIRLAALKHPIDHYMADVARVLEFASPSHLTSTAQRVCGTRSASLARFRTGDIIERFKEGRGRSRG